MVLVVYLLIANYRQNNIINNIKKISLEISRETYDSGDNSIKRYSIGEAQKRLLEKKEKNLNSKIKLEQVNVSSFDEIEEEVIVTTEIQEYPFKTVIFHEFIFKKLDDKWLVVNFNCDV
ncbi:MAG: hypothetical protein VB128_16135 [Sedimentibacter saalensis]|uniref:hypothetical protein n=1 Tax=Sedimentibacter saalensis TaxID=130788 RepID=UPI0011A14994|nr:hypothetical protein [Sedimentibacter saalensis]MEA5096482.1 hypothetical protein [Sedimentibacter saalensis]